MVAQIQSHWFWQQNVFFSVVSRLWTNGTVDLVKPGIEKRVHDGDEVRTTVKTSQFLRRAKLSKTTIVTGFSSLFLFRIQQICVYVKTKAGKTMIFKLKDMKMHKCDHHSWHTCGWEEHRWWIILKKDDATEKVIFSNLTVRDWFIHTLKDFDSLKYSMKCSAWSKVHLSVHWSTFQLDPWSFWFNWIHQSFKFKLTNWLAMIVSILNYTNSSVS
jgi:hypothetical protein